jgi:hypothetical protein
MYTNERLVLVDRLRGWEGWDRLAWNVKVKILIKGGGLRKPPPSRFREAGWFGLFLYFIFQTISTDRLSVAGLATYVYFDFLVFLAYSYEVAGLAIFSIFIFKQFEFIG